MSGRHISGVHSITQLAGRECTREMLGLRICHESEEIPQRRSSGRHSDVIIASRGLVAPRKRSKELGPVPRACQAHRGSARVRMLRSSLRRHHRHLAGSQPRGREGGNWGPCLAHARMRRGTARAQEPAVLRPKGPEETAFKLDHQGSTPSSLGWPRGATETGASRCSEDSARE